jgi:hypothetical protein
MASLSDFVSAGGAALPWTIVTTVTDSTSVTANSSTPVAIGSSFNITLPPSGIIGFLLVSASLTSTTTVGSVEVGLRTSSTNYMSRLDQDYYNNYGAWLQGIWGNQTGPLGNYVGGIRFCALDIATLGIPTGTISAELMVSRPVSAASGSFTFNGVARTTRIKVYTAEVQ